MARPARGLSPPHRRERAGGALVIPFRPRGRRRGTYHRYRRPRRRVWAAFGVLLGVLVLVFWWLGSARHTAPHAAPYTRVAGPPLLAPGAYHPQRRLAAPTPAPTTAPVGIGPLPIAGAPSLSARVVDGILAAYGSPLHGHGKELVALSRRYHLDDAVALAFFVMESRAGTQGEAVLTHSFGNLRPMAGEPQRDGYRSYTTWLAGATEWYQVLRSLYVRHLGLSTVEDIVPVYAPATDYNDPSTLIYGIRQLVACWRGALDACPADPAAVPAIVASGAHRS